MASQGASRIRVIAIAVGVWVAVVAGIVLVSGIVAEPKRSTPDHVAIGNRDGHLEVLACVDGGVGDATVSQGSRGSDGPTAWSVRLTGGPALQVVPLDDHVAGYQVAGSALTSGSTDEYNLNNLRDSGGQPLLTTIVTFRPSDLSPGWVQPARGDQQSLSDWATTAGCR